MTATQTPLLAWPIVATAGVVVVGIGVIVVLTAPHFPLLLPPLPLPVSVTVSGAGDRPVTPGTVASFDLLLTNHGSDPISIERLETTIRAIEAPAATAVSPCTVRDFVVTAPTGPLTVVVWPGTTRLSALQVPREQWPSVGMADSSLNQQGCSGATLLLDFVVSVEVAE